MAGVAERLADQGRSGWFAIFPNNQAAIGLITEGNLRNAGHDERIKRAGDKRQHEKECDGRTNEGFHLDSSFRRGQDRQ
ncbi:MAG: hypothetical protein BWY57_01960 [Betaproteobacteria bacterium ADurb.Bin341]|nr:MAG: hypothetical protein BWY57_01960 [Betaproteobacteria bacterium ADurb.Bin341]